ncbi:MAG: hypothetical protein ABDH32_02340 [Candidatus Caldarchaeales archaeon]
MDEEFRSLVARILRAVPGISREDIDFMVDEKMKSNPYLNRVGALLLVAEELGVFDVRRETPLEVFEELSYSKIGDLVPGLNNVSIRGVVYAITRPIDLRSHRLLRIKIGDKTGVVEVCAWNDKVDEVKNISIKIGDQIAILNGYTRERIETGGIEVHLGKNSSVKKLAHDPSLPEPYTFYKTISEIFEKGKGIYDLRAYIVHIGDERKVTTRSGELTVIDILLTDTIREARLSVWTDKIESFKNLKIGEEIFITDVRFEDGRFTLTSRSDLAMVREERDELIKRLEEKKIVLRVLDVSPSDDYTLITVTDGSRILQILYQDSIKLDYGEYIEASMAISDTLSRSRFIRCGRDALKKITPPSIEIPIPDRLITLKDIVERIAVDMENVIVEGILYTKTNPILIETKYGVIEKILFWLKEENVAVQGVAWRSKAIEISQLSEGSKIRLRWVNIKLNPFNEPEISVNHYSKIEKIP